jgi:C-terminal processing protease CtpA/Prc
MLRHLSLPLLLLAPACVLVAQAPPSAIPVSASDQKAVIATLNEKLKVRYVFPEVANKVSAALQTKLAKGEFDHPTTVGAFSELLSKELRELAQDGHFRVRFDPGFKAEQEDEDKPLTKEEIVQNRLEAAKMAYGLERVDRLPGNVGYLEVRGFGPTEFVGPAYSQAMALLSGSDAIIVDLRRNNGGRPESVAFLMSHFFGEGEARHLNDIYDRPANATRQYWTDPSAGPRFTGPVYVLTSRRTFSGGEECAYDFQTQKRGTLVGEVTGGGANPGSLVSMGHGFVAFIPSGRAINPVTKTNWEHVGVKPDVAVPAADALRTAHAAALKTIIQNEKDPEDRQQLEALLARVEKGEPEKPNYAPRR